MEGVSPQRTDKPQNRPNAPAGGDGTPQPGAPTGQSWRWLWGVLAIGIVAVLLAVGTIKTTNAKSISYTKYMQEVTAKQVSTAQISNSNGQITGKLKDGSSYTVQGPSPSLPNDVSTMRSNGVEVSFPTPSSNLFTALLPYLFIIGIGAAFIYFIGRQTRGQMSGIMSIGRSRAKVYTSERPRDHLRRRGRLQRGQAGDQRGRRLPQAPRPASRRSGPRSPRASCSWARRAPARPCWPGPSPARRACPSCR